MNPIVSAIAGIIKPVTDLIGDLHTSVEEKGALQLGLAQVQVTFASQILDYEAKLLDAQKSVIVAEAQGGSWLQRSWRPLTMLSFVLMIAADLTGFLPNRLPDQAWPLLQLGLGGYVVGRSAEKVLPGAIAAIANVRVGGKK